MRKKIYRSRTNKVIAGVCAGIGDYLGIDPNFVRLITILIGMMSAFFPVIIAYLLCMFFIPIEPKNRKPTTYRKIYRIAENKIIAGFCSGLGTCFHIEINVVRIVYAIVCALTGFLPLIILYIAAWVLIPEKSKTEMDEIEVFPK